MNYIKPKISYVKLTKTIWLIVVLICVFWKGIISGWQTQSSDFNNYYTASKLIIKKEPIHKFYDTYWFNNKAKEINIEAGAKFSPFPPITAYVFLPLTIWEPITAKRIWLIINVFILVVLIRRIKIKTTWSLKRTMLFMSLFLFPICSNLSSGQIYVVISWLLLEVISSSYFFNKPSLTGIILGVLSSLKYLPLLFLGYLVKHQKRTKILYWFILAVLFPSLVIYCLDNQSFTAFFNHFISHIQGNLLEQGKYAVGFQSMDSLLNNLFVSHIAINPNPLVDLPLLKPLLKIVLIVIIVGLLFYLFKKNRNQITPIFTSICIIGAFVILPASASYHFLLLIWPLTCIFRYFITFKSRKIIPILATIVFFTFNVQLHHMPNFTQFPKLNLILHFPRLWGLLLLFLFVYFQYYKKLSSKYG
uniref:glycosyltransferase family 87 protein n=1 Tax=Flavobacterium sp. TaxID=239 RepID=UPI00404B97B4